LKNFGTLKIVNKKLTSNRGTPQETLSTKILSTPAHLYEQKSHLQYASKHVALAYNECNISRDMRFRKVSNCKCNLQGHQRP